MVATHKSQFNKRHGFPASKAHSLADLAKISKMKLKVLKEVFSRGAAAFSTSPSSVRPHVKSPEEWGQARVYAFINKIESGKKLDHDTDLR